MAFDGITIRALKEELKSRVERGRIVKITQPEANEIILQIKNNRETFHLFLSASPSLPLIYLTEDKKSNPLQAPLFCMFLRKYIGGGIIEEISQPDLERVIKFSISHQNEMGDKENLFLIIEIMGKHSNIILHKEDNTILESIRHVSLLQSSVREVLPGREYFLVTQDDKHSFLKLSNNEIMDILYNSNESLSKSISQYFTGISFFTATQFLISIGIDPGKYYCELSEEEKIHFENQLTFFKSSILDNQFNPLIFYKDTQPIEYSVLFQNHPKNLETKSFNSTSQMLESYYISKNKYHLILQKTTNLRKRLQTLLERNKKKKNIQEKQLLDARKRDIFKLYGELLMAYTYQLSPGKSCEVRNYYDNETIKIPLKENLSITENANRYFEKYQKLKRTQEALTAQLEDTNREIIHLESILTSISLSDNDADLELIKEEMIKSGYQKKSGVQLKGKQKSNEKSNLLHYVSNQGLDIFVGKNNIQNEEITFNLGRPKDWWFHLKNMPGSHVLLVTKDGEMPDDKSFEEAASLAAYYSSCQNQKLVEVDYTQIKNLKKPPKSPIGMVIYHQNYSMMISPKIDEIKKL